MKTNDKSIVKQLVCPVSNERVLEGIPRLVALLVIIVTLTGLVLKSYLIFGFLVLDFLIRAFTKRKSSPLAYVGNRIAESFENNGKRIDKAPKIFAARMGFALTAAIFVLYFMETILAVYILSGVLIFFATLESVFNICVGCYIYTYLVFPFFGGKKDQSGNGWTSDYNI